MAYFNADKINSLIDDGEITVEELRSNSLDSQVDTISTLLSIKQQEAVFKRLKDTRFTFKVSQPEMKNNDKSNVQPIKNNQPSQDILFPFLGLNTA